MNSKYSKRQTKYRTKRQTKCRTKRQTKCRTNKRHTKCRTNKRQTKCRTNKRHKNYSKSLKNNQSGGSASLKKETKCAECANYWGKGVIYWGWYSGKGEDLAKNFPPKSSVLATAKLLGVSDLVGERIKRDQMMRKKYEEHLGNPDLQRLRLRKIEELRKRKECLPLTPEEWDKQNAQFLCPVCVIKYHILDDFFSIVEPPFKQRVSGITDYNEITKLYLSMKISPDYLIRIVWMGGTIAHSAMAKIQHTLKNTEVGNRIYECLLNMEGDVVAYENLYFNTKNEPIGAAPVRAEYLIDLFRRGQAARGPAATFDTTSTESLIPRHTSDLSHFAYILPMTTEKLQYVEQMTVNNILNNSWGQAGDPRSRVGQRRVPDEDGDAKAPIMRWISFYCLVTLSDIYDISLEDLIKMEHNLKKYPKMLEMVKYGRPLYSGNFGGPINTEDLKLLMMEDLKTRQDQSLGEQFLVGETYINKFQEWREFLDSGKVDPLDEYRAKSDEVKLAQVRMREGLQWSTISFYNVDGGWDAHAPGFSVGRANLGLGILELKKLKDLFLNKEGILEKMNNTLIDLFAEEREWVVHRQAFTELAVRHGFQWGAKVYLIDEGGHPVEMVVADYDYKEDKIVFRNVDSGPSEYVGVSHTIDEAAEIAKTAKAEIYGLQIGAVLYGFCPDKGIIKTEVIRYLGYSANGGVESKDEGGRLYVTGNTIEEAAEISNGGLRSLHRAKAKTFGLEEGDEIYLLIKGETVKTKVIEIKGDGVLTQTAPGQRTVWAAGKTIEQVADIARDMKARHYGLQEGAEIYQWSEEDKKVVKATVVGYEGGKLMCEWNKESGVLHKEAIFGDTIEDAAGNEEKAKMMYYGLPVGAPIYLWDEGKHGARSAPKKGTVKGYHERRILADVTIDGEVVGFQARGDGVEEAAKYSEMGRIIYEELLEYGLQLGAEIYVWRPNNQIKPETGSIPVQAQVVGHRNTGTQVLCAYHDEHGKVKRIWAAGKDLKETAHESNSVKERYHELLDNGLQLGAEIYVLSDNIPEKVEVVGYKGDSILYERQTGDICSVGPIDPAISSNIPSTSLERISKWIDIVKKRYFEYCTSKLQIGDDIYVTDGGAIIRGKVKGYGIASALSGNLEDGLLDPVQVKITFMQGGVEREEWTTLNTFERVGLISEKNEAKYFGLGVGAEIYVIRDEVSVLAKVVGYKEGRVQVQYPDGESGVAAGTTIEEVAGISGEIADKIAKAKGLADSGEEHCSICLEDFLESDDISKTECSHWFHKDCLTGWFQQKTPDGAPKTVSTVACPICRSNIALSDIAPELCT
jgi:hypothetical protein